jgi:hypothetical protein
MTLKDLYAAIEQLEQRQFNYPLNTQNQIDTYVLGYNKREGNWEYYFLNERGGKSDFKTFATEEEACRYVLDTAIEYNKTFHDSWIDAVRRRFE